MNTETDKIKSWSLISKNKKDIQETFEGLSKLFGDGVMRGVKRKAVFDEALLERPKAKKVQTFKLFFIFVC